MWDSPTTHRYGGLYVAHVEDVDSSSRVKVSIPAVFETLDSQAMVWARPCFPWAHFFVPQVGDMLWVAFEGGDPSAPVWIGVWYKTGSVPPQADVSKPLRRVIATPKNNIIVLDDTDGSETIIIQDKAGNKITLDSNGVVITSVGDMTIDASGHKIEIKAQEVNVVKA